MPLPHGSNDDIVGKAKKFFQVLLLQERPALVVMQPAVRLLPNRKDGLPLHA